MSQLDEVFRRTLATHSQVIDPMAYLAQDILFPALPPQPTQLLSTLTEFFTTVPGLETQNEVIYADVRGGYISNSLEGIAAGVLSSVQGRPGTNLTPGSFIRAAIAMLEAEIETVAGVFGPESDIFFATSVSAMNLFSRTFKALSTQIRGAANQNLPLILSILDDLTVAQDIFSRTTISKDVIDGMSKDIATLEREARGIGGVGVGDVVEDVRRRGAAVASLPGDGGIIDLTTEVPTPLNPLTLDNL
jgi:hypothetical protein